MKINAVITKDEFKLAQQGLPSTLKGKKLTALQKESLFEKGFVRLQHDARTYVINRNIVDISSPQIKFENYV